MRLTIIFSIWSAVVAEKHMHAKCDIYIHNFAFALYLHPKLQLCQSLTEHTYRHKHIPQRAIKGEKMGESVER